MAKVFTIPEFLKTSNIYEVNIRQYTAAGTFSAFAQHLPRLKETGVEILWLMPVHPIGVVKRKGTLGSYYSIQDHCGINPEFGDEKDFSSLIEAAHSLGMKVILDWVANHTAWDHLWTTTNPEFYVRNEAGEFVPPYDWDDVLQLDHGNHAEQAAMIDAMEYWVRRFDVDGFRADLAHLTPLPFWKAARTNLTAIKKDLIWLAETEEINYHEAFDISFTWEWMHATEKLFRRQMSLTDCIRVLTKYRESFPQEALRMFFTSNHDENSWNGTAHEKYGFMTNALRVFSCTYPGVPLIYSGEEGSLEKRLKFFEKDEVEWNDTGSESAIYQQLFRLRKRNDQIYSAGTKSVRLFPDAATDNVLCFEMTAGSQCVIVLINLSEEKVIQSVSAENAKGLFREIFSEETLTLEGTVFFNAEAGGYRVFERLKTPGV